MQIQVLVAISTLTAFISAFGNSHTIIFHNLPTVVYPGTNITFGMCHKNFVHTALLEFVTIDIVSLEISRYTDSKINLEARRSASIGGTLSANSLQLRLPLAGTNSKWKGCIEVVMPIYYSPINDTDVRLQVTIY